MKWKDFLCNFERCGRAKNQKFVAARHSVFISNTLQLAGKESLEGAAIIMQRIIVKYMDEIEGLDVTDEIGMLISKVEGILCRMMSEIITSENRIDNSSKKISELELITFLLDKVGYSYASKSVEYNVMYKTEAINRLFMMYVKAFRETVYLLRGGFASAALSRVRFIYEIAVFIDTINNQDESVAKKFLIHSNKNRLKIANSLSDLELVQKIKEQLREFECGEEFFRDYGWASQILNMKKITFKDVARLSSFSELYYLYCLCCENTHANIFNSLYGIDVNNEEKGESVWITTPSNEGVDLVIKILLLLSHQINSIRFITSNDITELTIDIMYAKIANVAVDLNSH